MTYVEFGTGGWRGIIGDTFTKANIQRVVYSTLDEIKENGVLVAKDNRFLSDEAMEWVLEVLCAYDKNVYIVEDAIPTPTMMHAVKVNEYDLGIMITASHNISKYNGIKIITAGGRDANVTKTRELQKKANEVENIKTVRVANDMYEIIRPNNDYVVDVMNLLKSDQIRNQNYRVAVDNMHSVSHRLIPMLLGNIGVEFDMIREHRDPLFGNEEPNPTAETLKQLQLLMEKNKYDLGIATDADGDRIGLLDEHGMYVHPNTILSLLYRFLLDAGHKGPVVRNISTTHLVDEIAKRYNEQSFEEAVGFKNISESMTESNALIGGESSGGITTRNHIDGKDGIYSSLLVLQMMSFYNRPLSEIILDLEKDFGSYYFIEDRYDLSSEQSSIIIKNIKKKYENDEKITINMLDGIKIIYECDSWVSFRKSGTEDVCRMFIESKDEDFAAKLHKQYDKDIRSWKNNGL